MPTFFAKDFKNKIKKHGKSFDVSFLQHRVEETGHVKSTGLTTPALSSHVIKFTREKLKRFGRVLSE